MTFDETLLTDDNIRQVFKAIQDQECNPNQLLALVRNYGESIRLNERLVCIDAIKNSAHLMSKPDAIAAAHLLNSLKVKSL